jgi:acetyl-CoA acetyltransferase
MAVSRKFDELADDHIPVAHDESSRVFGRFAMTAHAVVFAEPVRTAIGTFGGSLKEVPAPNLGAVAIGAAVARAKLRIEEVETVVMGNVVQAGTKMDPARQAAIHSGFAAAASR